MTDSHCRRSFREGWQPTGLSRDVTLNFQLCLQTFDIPLDVLYYFKPISTFNVPGLSASAKVEDVDEYIAAEFGCDPDDIWTVDSGNGPVIVMSETALLTAGVKLPRWPERNLFEQKPSTHEPLAPH